MSKKIYKEKYFPHDRHARQDPKIKSLLVHFRKISNEKAQAAICIYWWIVEDMHTDDYPIDKLEAFADDYRCDVEFLKSILNDFDLFRIENNCYVSDRVLRNLQEQQEKSDKARAKAEKRWQGKKKPDEAPAEPDDIQIDNELVTSIIQIYNSEFKKSQIVGNVTREKIYKITKENNVTLEIWKKVFENAKRGWNIKGENKKPILKNILENWDAFASDDYFLVPDEQAQQKQKEQEELENKKAERFISFNREIDLELSLHDEYRVLKDSKKVKAIEFYKSNKNSIPGTIAYIKKGLD